MAQYIEVTIRGRYTPREDAYGTTSLTEAAEMDKQSLETGQLDIIDLLSVLDDESVETEFKVVDPDEDTETVIQPEYLHMETPIEDNMPQPGGPLDGDDGKWR